MSSNLQEPTQIASRQSNRLKWTTEMNNTLLDCKAKAQALTNSQNPPRKENGRKKGYMAIMKELWDNCGYAELNIPEKIYETRLENWKRILEVYKVLF